MTQIMNKAQLEAEKEAPQMDNYPIFSANLPAGEIKQLESPSEQFSNVCDETRYLMWDWMEYQEKQGIAVSHNVYLDTWARTFNQVYAKRENIK